MPAKSQIRKDAELIVNELGYASPNTVFVDNPKDGKRVKLSGLQLNKDDLAYARKRFAELNPNFDTRVHHTDPRWNDVLHVPHLRFYGLAFKIFNI